MEIFLGSLIILIKKMKGQLKVVHLEARTESRYRNFLGTTFLFTAWIARMTILIKKIKKEVGQIRDSSWFFCQLSSVRLWRIFQIRTQLFRKPLSADVFHSAFPKGHSQSNLFPLYYRFCFCFFFAETQLNRNPGCWRRSMSSCEGLVEIEKCGHQRTYLRISRGMIG